MDESDDPTTQGRPCPDTAAVLRELVERLRGRRGDVVAATRGQPIRVQLTLVSDAPRSHLVVITGEGRVHVVRPAALGGTPFRPDLVLVGRPDQVRSTLMGSIEWNKAVAAGLAVTSVDFALLDSLRRVLADELVTVLGRHRP